MMRSEKEQEQLIGIVAQLTEQYTSRESTSIPYEKARMLMEAVLYCIHEFENETKRENVLQAEDERLDLVLEYKKGYEIVLAKAKQANAFYNQLCAHFSAYGNLCYYDTVVKGMLQFFLYYDARFCPQDHLLSLDYPLLQSVMEFTGIDCIERYLYLVALEQKFLSSIGEEHIMELYNHVNYEYKEAIENVCRMPLRYIIANRLLGAEKDKLSLGDSGREQMRQLAMSKSPGELLQSFRHALQQIVKEEYENDQSLYAYLSMDLQDYVVEIQNAAKYDNITAIFPV